MTSFDCPAIAAEDGALEYHSAFFGTWAQARDATGGSWNKDGTANDPQYYVANADRHVGDSFGYYVAHGYLSFDLSSIPTGATITGAVLHEKGYTGSSTAGGNLQLFEGTQGSSLTTADWTAYGSTDLMTAVAFSSLNFAGWNDFTLNAAGIALIQSKLAAGKVQFCHRTSHDVSNTQPATDTTRSALGIRFGEYSTSTDRPYLTVTYTAITGTDTLAFSDFAEGNRKARSGADTISFTDSGSRQVSRPRSGTDTVALTDTARYVPTIAGTDALSFSDSGRRTLYGPGAPIAAINPNGDADVGQINNSASWSALAATGSGTVNESDVTFVVAAIDGTTVRTLRRGFLSFASPATGPYQRAVLRLRASPTGFANGAGGSISVVGSTAAATPASTDFDNVETTKYTSDIPFATLSTSGYTEVDLNESGLAYLNSRIGVGDIRLALRTSFDLTATGPATGTSSSVAFVASENGSLKPELVLYPRKQVGRGADTFVFSDGSGWDKGTAHSRPAVDLLTLTDRSTMYVRSTTEVMVQPEGANTTLSGDGSGSIDLTGVTSITVMSTAGWDQVGEGYVSDNATGDQQQQARFSYTGISGNTFTGVHNVVSLIGSPGAHDGNLVFVNDASVSAPNAESHFPQINALDDSDTPELLITYTQHFAHSGLLGRIAGRKSTNGGRTWGDEFSVVSAPANNWDDDKAWGIFGHLLKRLKNGRLFCMWYEHGMDYSVAGDPLDIRVMSSYSDDNAVTWSTPIEYDTPYTHQRKGSAGFGSMLYTGPGSDPTYGDLYIPVMGTDGTVQVEVAEPHYRWYSKLMKVTDGGTSGDWDLVGTMATTAQTGGYANGEPDLIIAPNGVWIAQFRVEDQSLNRWQAESTDMGATWTNHHYAIGSLANGAVLTRLPGGALLSTGQAALLARDGPYIAQSVSFVSTNSGTTWPEIIRKYEATDSTYNIYNGADTDVVFDDPLVLNTVFAYSQERSTQSGARTMFRWYVDPLHYAADSFSLTDAVARSAQTFNRSGTDSLAFSDTSIGVRQTINRSASDALSFTDAATRSSATRSRTGADTLAFSDVGTQSSTHSFGRTGSDTLTLTDSGSGSISAPHSFTKTGSDTLSWSDTTTRSSSTNKATIIYDTYVTSDQFGTRTVSSDMFGSRTSDTAVHSTEVQVHTETSIS